MTCNPAGLTDDKAIWPVDSFMWKSRATPPGTTIIAFANFKGGVGKTTCARECRRLSGLPIRQKGLTYRPGRAGLARAVADGTFRMASMDGTKGAHHASIVPGRHFRIARVERGKRNASNGYEEESLCVSGLF